MRNSVEIVLLFASIFLAMGIISAGAYSLMYLVGLSS
jgi:hypothetical protein